MRAHLCECVNTSSVRTFPLAEAKDKESMPASSKQRVVDSISAEASKGKQSTPILSKHGMSENILFLKEFEMQKTLQKKHMLHKDFAVHDEITQKRNSNKDSVTVHKRRLSNKLAKQKQRRKEKDLLSDDASKCVKVQESKKRQLNRVSLSDVKKAEIRQKDRNAQKRKRLELNEDSKKIIREKETMARNLHRSELDEEKLEEIRNKDTAARKRHRTELDDEMEEQIRKKETATRREHRSELDEEKLEEIRNKDTAARKRHRTELDDEMEEQIRKKETATRKEHRSKLDEEKREEIRNNDTATRIEHRKELDEASQQRIRENDIIARRSKRRDLANLYEEKFKRSIKEFPVYFCCCCHRTNYRQLVQLVSEEKYCEIERNLLNTYLTNKVSFDNKRYICTCCNSKLMRSRMPAMAVANNLRLYPVPEGLKCLRELECILIAQRIIFFKMVNLPRGRQKGVVGSFVNIPSDTETVCASLPRTLDQSGIIALKLKRKVSYKGHHLHQNIRPDRVVGALNWLVQNNDLYKNVRLSGDWVQRCQEENEDLWNSLFGDQDNDGDEDSDEQSSDKEGKTDEKKGNKSGEEIDEEEDVQQKVRGVQYDTCLHPNNNIASTQKEYCIAPGEGKSPLDPFIDTKCEALAFPHLFPTWRGTFLGDNEDIKRTVPLTAKKYFIQRVSNADNRFASSVSYLFFALNVCEKQQIQNSVNIALRKARRMDVTVGQLKDPDMLHNIFIKDQAFQFLQQVRGSPTYWQHAQYELLAMVRAKGVFTWFLTLSCADLQWPETIQSIALQYGKVLSEKDVQNLSYEEKCSWLRQNPVIAARQFDHRLQSFFRDVIQSPAAPIGKVIHYFQRTEFQLRGSPHCHAVLWVENAPDIEKSSDEDICNWIDTYITCEIPEKNDPLYEEVLTKEVHTHSMACRKHGTTCRFHYPKPPSDKTLLSKPSDDEANPPLTQSQVQQILSKVNKVLTDDKVNVTDLTLREILNTAEVSKSNYYKALKYSKSGKSVVLKRKTSCLNVNNYNKDILQIWKANMDLQFVCDPYACISYIAAYVTKDERELSQMLKDAAKEMKNADVKSRLRKVGNVYLSNREISAQEAAYRLLSIPLKRCSSRMVWIPTDLPEDRIGILKPQTVLDELDEDDTEVYALSIVDKYQKRPDIPIISQLCLWEFVAWYGYSSATDDSKTSIQSEDSWPKTITLMDGKGMMKKYETPAIPRYHVFSVNKESEKFYHQQLMLFIPWKDELRDLRDDSSQVPYQSMYEKKRKAVLETKGHLEHHADLVEEALVNYDVNGPPQHAWDMLDPESEQGRYEDIRRMEEDQRNEANAIEVTPRPVTLAVSTKPNAIRDNMLREIIHSLNEKQRQVFTYIINWCKDTVAAKSAEAKPAPFHLFVTGGAGTGKSQLIKAVFHQVTRILQQAGDNPDYPVILLTSPTGTASYNIGGTTLHAALHLPRGRFYSLRSNPSLLATFRLSMSQLKILVIDEVSMVGRTMFAHVHRRLQEAKGMENADSLFGGVSILAVGDFYQLPPVRQCKIFDNEISNPDNVDPEELGVILAGLWEKKFSMVELVEIMRQKGDLPFAEMLNRLRTATFTEDDVNTLKTRIISAGSPSYPQNAPHLFANRESVANHNTIMLNSQTETKTQITAITRVPNVVKHFDVSQQVGGLENILTLCNHARVMLIKNLDVADGLVNGATGEILAIINSDKQSSMPKAIIVKFDNNKIGRLARQASKISLRNYKDGVPILPSEVKQHSGSTETSPEITRIQFPLVLCWACTIHKIQGATLDTVVISFFGLRNKGQAYVAISRATSLQGVHLLDFKPQLIKADPAVSGEITRLRQQPSEISSIEDHAIIQPDMYRICFFNSQSFWALHKKDILNDPHLCTSHLIALSETGQNDQSPRLKCYGKVITKPRTSQQGGGVALYCKSESELTLQELDMIFPDSIEALAAHVSSSAFSLNLMLLYSPPRTNLKDIYSAIKSFLQKHAGTNVIIGGDFNIDLNKPLNKVTRFLRDQGLVQITTSPTHQSGSHIDHVWTNITTPQPTVVAMWTYYSDHKQIYIDVTKNLL